MIPIPQLTPAAETLRKAILAVPETEEAIASNLPKGITPEDMLRLHTETMSATKWVILELRRLIARHPDFPTFYNYLKCAYQLRRETRQADQVDDETVARFPDYLFSRLALAGRALTGDGDPVAVLTHLGPTLSLPALYPERDVFHTSEILNYYHNVGLYHLRNDRVDLAYGVLTALRQIQEDHPACSTLERGIIAHNIASFKRRTERDRNLRITVDIPPRVPQPEPVAAPEFHHPGFADIYEYGAELPDSHIRTLLALPREPLVADLCRVLAYETARSAAGPDLGPADDTWAPIHALLLLGELRATEAIDTVLDFLAIDPEDLAFHLGNFNHREVFAGIFSDSFTRLGEWLKAPGIDSRAKGIVAGAITLQARRNPQLRTAAVTVIGDTISFMLAARPEDNVIDTETLSCLVSSALDLRAIELEPLITRAWDRNLVEEMIVGDLASILEDLATPPAPPPPVQSIFDSYEQLRAMSAEDEDYEDEDEDEEADNSLWVPPGHAASPVVRPGLYSLPEPKPSVGRNDPCPCGSGKKYKKCCMK